MNPKIISFDLDETLVKRHLIDKFWFEEVPKLYAERYGLELEEAVNRVRESYDELGPKDVRWYKPSFWFEKFGLETDPDVLVESLEGEVEYFDDVWSVLDSLSDDYRLIIITNAARIFTKVQLSGVQNYFSKVFSCTSDFGKVKSEGSVYERVCDSLHVDPSELVHIGDDMEFDYSVPSNVGVRAFLVDRERNNGSDQDVITDLREILEKI